MALAVTFNFVMQDAKGKSSICKVRVPTGFTVAQYIEFGQGFGQLLENWAYGQLMSVSFSVGLDLSGLSLKAVPAALSDVFQKGLMIARSAITGLFARFNIPTFDETKIVDFTDQIDTVDIDVAAVVDAITDGILVSGTQVQPVDVRGNDLIAVSTAREIFRKH